jgi:hypothetical protein
VAVAVAVIAICFAFLLIVVLATLYAFVLHRFLHPCMGPVFFVMNALRRVFGATEQEEQLEYTQLEIKLRSQLPPAPLGDVGLTAVGLGEYRSAALSSPVPVDEKNPLRSLRDWTSPVHSNALSRLLLKRPDADLPLPTAQGTVHDLHSLLQGIRGSPAATAVRPLSPVRRPISPIPEASSSAAVVETADSSPISESSQQGDGLSSVLRQRIGAIVEPPKDLSLFTAVRMAGLRARAQQRQMRRAIASKSTVAAGTPGASESVQLFWPAHGLRLLVRRPAEPASMSVGSPTPRTASAFDAPMSTGSPQPPPPPSPLMLSLPSPSSRPMSRSPASPVLPARRSSSRLLSAALASAGSRGGEPMSPMSDEREEWRWPESRGAAQVFARSDSDAEMPHTPSAAEWPQDDDV